MLEKSLRPRRVLRRRADPCWVLKVQKVWKLVGRMVAVVVGVRVRKGMGESSLMGGCSMRLRVSRRGRWMELVRG